MATTPNMNLLLPVVDVTPGPTYASENNNAFTTIDSHDHTTGKGVPVPSAGLNINADLSFSANNATNLRSTRFQSQSAVLSLPSDICELYVVSGNLFYNNQLGQTVQLTSGNAIDATSIGGIGGDYATSTALEFYTTSTRTFTFWSAANTPANLDAGSVTLRPIAVSPSGITLAAPSALSSSYTLTLPLTLPSSTSVVQVDPSGNVSFTGALLPSGSVLMWGGVSAPTGFLLCDGTSYLISAYPGIAAALFDSGTGLYAYGSADSTHFNVPDFRGMFPRGVDAGAGRDPDAASRPAFNANGNTGDAPGSYQADVFASHTHIETSGGGATPNYTNPGQISTGTTTNLPTSASTQATGGNETRPKNLYINFIIKT